MKNKQIYQNLSKLDIIWITKYHEKHEKEILYDESLKWLDWLLDETIEKEIIKFKKNNIYINELLELKYIKTIGYNQEFPTYYPILTDKWKIFLENYKNRNILDKFEDLIKIYPNSIKIPLSFIWWIIATIITIYIKTLIK